jgi:hypothetical protein
MIAAVTESEMSKPYLMECDAINLWYFCIKCRILFVEKKHEICVLTCASTRYEFVLFQVLCVTTRGNGAGYRNVYFGYEHGVGRGGGVGSTH